jgi:hypothetical protein
MDNKNQLWLLRIHSPIIKTASANLVSGGKKAGWYMWDVIPPTTTVKSSIHSTPINAP